VNQIPSPPKVSITRILGEFVGALLALAFFGAAIYILVAILREAPGLELNHCVFG
jgi:hypothetical protein